MRPALCAERLVKRYGGVTAVDGVDLAVAAGEVVGLLGPNGAGKTTTLRMLAGILSPDQGQILVGGVDLAARRSGEAAPRLPLGDTQLCQRLTPARCSATSVGCTAWKRRPRAGSTRSWPTWRWARSPRGRAARSPRGRSSARNIARVPPRAAGAHPRRADDRARHHQRPLHRRVDPAGARCGQGHPLLDPHHE